MEEIIKTKWKDILEHVKSEYSLTDVCYKTWISPLELYSVNEEESTAIISVNDYLLGESSKEIKFIYSGIHRRDYRLSSYYYI